MFQNRQEAGRILADKLKNYSNADNCIVVALPRGGVIIGAELACKLNLPLDIVSVRKLPAPHNPELAIGAVAQAGAKYIDFEMIARTGADSEYLESTTAAKFKEVGERIAKYRINPEYLLKFNKFILTDDGIATGATIRAAVIFLRSLKLPDKKRAKIILAVPVAAHEVFVQLRKEVAEAIVLEESSEFGAVGQFYRNFGQIDDQEVIKFLNKYRRYR